MSVSSSQYIRALDFRVIQFELGPRQEHTYTDVRNKALLRLNFCNLQGWDWESDKSVMHER